MELQDVDPDDVIVAHRGGTPKNQYDRPMIVRCSYPLRERVLKNSSKLKVKENSKGNTYYVNQQLPDVLQEKNRQNRETIKKIRTQEATLPQREKSRIEIKEGKVLVDGIQRKSHLLPIEPLDLFPDKAEREKWNRIKTVSLDTVDEQSSSFTAIAAKCSQFIEVKRAYRKIRALNPAANHVVPA